jgi:hypothetical protein
LVTPPALSTILVRFWFGAAGSLAAGLIAFGRAVFDPEGTAFFCVSVGTLAAGVFALVRVSRAGQALALVVFFALLQRLLGGWPAAAAGLVFGVGALLVALIFDLLARRGFYFGKFLIAGPLLGGVFLAAAPIAEFNSLTSTGAVRTLMYYVFLGVLIGDGVGLGVEIADLGVTAAARLRGDSEAQISTPEDPGAPTSPR